MRTNNHTASEKYAGTLYEIQRETCVYHALVFFESDQMANVDAARRADRTPRVLVRDLVCAEPSQPAVKCRPGVVGGS